jgi:two-component sensor histidine kinase
MASTPLAAPFFARLSPSRFSTGIKMLIILTVALLPLGMIALFASIQSAQRNQAQREAETRMIATAEARQIDIVLLRAAGMIRANLSGPEPDSATCATLLERDLDAMGVPVRLALFRSDGTPACATAGYDATHLQRPSMPGIQADLLPGEQGLRFAVPATNGTYGVGEISAATLRRLLVSDGNQGIQLTEGSRRLVISNLGATPPLVRHVRVSAPAASGQISLHLNMLANPVSAVEVLLVLLPLLMWGAAATICWIVLDQALVRPLRLMQRAIAIYQPGDGPLTLPRILTPAEEIRSLGEALESTAAQLVAREQELEQGLIHQMRLTREVHHRVKNNLQVVASLINLHARGTDGDVAAAYASIQRRVDALAVVHRNHYAELEENRGVALRSIVAELTANLRATAPAPAQHLMITLEMMPAFITQDVAVPVAFLVTEIVELVMNCDPTATIAIALRPGSAPDRAILSIQSPRLGEDICELHPSRARFERIITGLARQLRSHLDYDGTAGRYQIEIAVTADPAPAEKN